eukprot:6729859-Pyramimonas_sp.AAC.1
MTRGWKRNRSRPPTPRGLVGLCLCSSCCPIHAHGVLGYAKRRCAEQPCVSWLRASTASIPG